MRRKGRTIRWMIGGALLGLAVGGFITLGGRLGILPEWDGTTVERPKVPEGYMATGPGQDDGTEDDFEASHRIVQNLVVAGKADEAGALIKDVGDPERRDLLTMSLIQAMLNVADSAPDDFVDEIGEDDDPLATKALNLQDISRAFDLIDADNDDAVTAAELEAIGDPPTPFEEMDEDGSGTVSLEEFAKVVGREGAPPPDPAALADDAGMDATETEAVPESPSAPAIDFGETARLADTIGDPLIRSDALSRIGAKQRDSDPTAAAATLDRAAEAFRAYLAANAPDASNPGRYVRAGFWMCGLGLIGMIGFGAVGRALTSFEESMRLGLAEELDREAKARPSTGHVA